MDTLTATMLFICWRKKYPLITMVFDEKALLRTLPICTIRFLSRLPFNPWNWSLTCYACCPLWKFVRKSLMTWKCLKLLATSYYNGILIANIKKCEYLKTKSTFKQANNLIKRYIASNLSDISCKCNLKLPKFIIYFLLQKMNVSYFFWYFVNSKSVK